jgi:membrane-associated phospholipid phosphatase
METKTTIMDASLIMPPQVTTSHGKFVIVAVLFLLLIPVSHVPAHAAQGGGAGIPRPGEEQRTLSLRSGLRDLPRDLARNTRQLFSRPNFLPLMIGAGASAAAHPADTHLREYFDRPRLGRAGDVFGAKLGSGGVVAAAVGSVWVASRIHHSDDFARFGDDLTQASLLNGLLTFGLKQSINRNRPSGGHYSFPSGHTSSAFAVASVVDHHYGWKASVAAYTAATFIGASRIDSRKHYLSDVVAGATVGYIVGRTVTRSGSGSPAIHWSPIVSSSSETVGIALSWNLSRD